MTDDRIPANSEGDSSTIMGAIAQDSSGSTFVIADISADDRWLSIAHTEAPRLSEWR